MATDLSSGPSRPAKAPESSGETTEEAVIDMMPRECVARREPARLRELFGRLEWHIDYDYKHERSRI